LHGLAKLGERDKELVSIYKQRYEFTLNENEGGFVALNHMLGQKYNHILNEVIGLIDRMAECHFGSNEKDKTVYKVNNLSFMVGQLPIP